MNLICKGDKMIFQYGLISAIVFCSGGKYSLEVIEVPLLTRSSAAMQICSACTISLTDRLLLGMAFPKQLSFRCLIKQLAEKFDLITKITRKSIHHTTPLKKTCFLPPCLSSTFLMWSTLPVLFKMLMLIQFWC